MSFYSSGIKAADVFLVVISVDLAGANVSLAETVGTPDRRHPQHDRKPVKTTVFTFTSDNTCRYDATAD